MRRVLSRIPALTIGCMFAIALGQTVTILGPFGFLGGSDLWHRSLASIYQSKSPHEWSLWWLPALGCGAATWLTPAFKLIGAARRYTTIHKLYGSSFKIKKRKMCVQSLWPPTGTEKHLRDSSSFRSIDCQSGQCQSYRNWSESQYMSNSVTIKELISAEMSSSLWMGVFTRSIHYICYSNFSSNFLNNEFVLSTYLNHLS